MKYHILTSFFRVENREKLIKNFHRPNVIWHPLMDVHFEFPKEDWIRPFDFVRDPKVRNKYDSFCYHAYNKFLDANTLEDEDYYQFLADDDCLEPTFYDKLEGIDTPIIFVSCKRGDHATEKGYNPTTLVPYWRRLTRSRIAGEQIIVKGKVLKNERFEVSHTADGHFASELWKKYPHKDFTFAINAYVWFNYLEPGRWDNVII